MKNIISDKTISRLTLYHSILTDYISRKNEYISSGQIAELLHIDASQVRKDINLLNNSGKSRIGYLVKDLKSSIENTLSFKKTKKALIVGAGNLGTAIANYTNFSNYGLKIFAIFDNDMNKTGRVINGMEIQNIYEITPTARNNDIDIAILTVPAQHAQQIADLLVNAHIKYIWNFTPAVLSVPDNVQVWNENLIGNFLQFTYGM